MQKCTKSLQQIGRTFRDKGVKEWKEIGAMANNNNYLNRGHQFNKVYTKPNN